MIAPATFWSGIVSSRESLFSGIPASGNCPTYPGDGHIGIEDMER